MQAIRSEATLRKLALATNLLLLSWIGWTVGQSIAEWNRPEIQTPARIVPIPVDPPHTVDRGSDIASWHLFGEPGEQSVVQAPDKSSAPPTSLKLELYGVFLDQPEADSIAIIAEPGKTQLHYRRGDLLPGNAELDEIHSDHVILLRNGRYETLALTETSAGSQTAFRPAASNMATPVIAAAQVATAPGASLPDNQPASLTRMLKMQPVMKDGEFRGMSMSGGSGKGRRLLGSGSVKLKQSDVITSINGTEITSAEAGQALLDNYSTADRLELVIDRDGERIPVVLNQDSGN